MSPYTVALTFAYDAIDTDTPERAADVFREEMLADWDIDVVDFAPDGITPVIYEFCDDGTTVRNAWRADVYDDVVTCERVPSAYALETE